MKLTDILQLTIRGQFYASYITALTGTSYLLNSAVVTNPGSGYASAPTVSFSGGGGTGAAAAAIIQNGSVIEITITNPGSGYTSAPSVSLSGGGFDTAATASSTIVPVSLDGIPTSSQAVAPTIIVPVLIGSPKKINFYYLRAGTDAESSPNIIRPNDYNGSTNQKVWEWIGVNGPGGSV